MDVENVEKDSLDDQGTTQEEARTLLETLLHEGFDEEIDLLAQALGRPTEEIESFINGDERIDEDLLMKARGLAQERDLDIH